MDLTESSLDVRDAQLALYRFAGSGNRCLLAHGVGLCAAMFGPLAQQLATRFAPVGFDLAGHGHSTSRLHAPSAWEGYVSDTLAVAQAGGGSLSGIGHSLGATTMLLAEASRPGTFAWLYCFEPPMFTQDEVDGAQFADFLTVTRARRATFASRQDALEHFRNRGLFSELDDAALRAYVTYGLGDDPSGGLRLVVDPGEEAAIYANVVVDRFEDLRRVACPVVIGYGSASAALWERGARRIATYLPQARLERIEGAGHLAPYGAGKGLLSSIITANEWASA